TRGHHEPFAVALALPQQAHRQDAVLGPALVTKIGAVGRSDRPDAVVDRHRVEQGLRLARAQIDHQPRYIVRAREPFEAVYEARAGGEADAVDIGEGQAGPIGLDQLALRSIIALDKERA